MRHANKSETSVSNISVSQLQQQEIYSFNVWVLLWHRGASFLTVRSSSGWQSFLHPHSPRRHLCCTGIRYGPFIWGHYRIRQDGGRWCTMEWWMTKNVLQRLRTYFSNAFLQQPCYKGSSPEDTQQAPDKVDCMKRVRKAAAWRTDLGYEKKAKASRPCWRQSP